MDFRNRAKLGGEALSGWILFETRILGLQASTVRSKISGLGYWHLLSGFPDWSKWSGRYKKVLRSAAKQDVTCRNYPFNLGLVNWVYAAFRHPIGPDARVERGHHSPKYEICEAMTSGFFFLLRASEIGN